MPRPAGKPVRVRASLLDREGECLVLLPRGFRAAALSILERMGWQKTWIDDQGHSVVLTDTQVQQVELGLARMGDCVDIINNITVSPNIDCGCSGGGGGVTVNCGDGGETVVTIPGDEPVLYDPEENAPEDQEGGALNPSGDIPESFGEHIQTWDDYDTWACDLSHYTVQMLSRSLRAGEIVSNKVTTVAGALSVVGAIWPAGFAAKIGITTLAELIEAIIQLFIAEELGDELADLADELSAEPLYSDLVCTLYDARYYLPGARSSLLQDIQQSVYARFTEADTRDRVMAFIDNSVPARWLLGELVETTLRPVDKGNDCACSESATDSHVWSFASDANTWDLSGNATHVTDQGGAVKLFTRNDTNPPTYARMTAQKSTTIGAAIPWAIAESGYRIVYVRVRAMSVAADPSLVPRAGLEFYDNQGAVLWDTGQLPATWTDYVWTGSAVVENQGTDEPVRLTTIDNDPHSGPSNHILVQEIEVRIIRTS